MKTDQPENVTFPMAKENKSNPHLLRIVLLITATLLVVFMLQMAIKTDLTHKVNVSLRWTVVTSLGVVGILVCLALFVITFTSSWQSHQTSLLHSLTFLHKLRYANILFLIILYGGFSYVVLGPWGRYLTDYLSRLCLFWLAGLAGSVVWMGLLTSRDTPHWLYDIPQEESAKGWLKALVLSYLFLGVVYRIAVFFPSISTYPFSLDWSEASRYYYASLFFGKRLYGVKTVPSALHPSRYLLQAIPFLVSGLPLWFHRLWQVLLWIGLTFYTAYLLTRRAFLRMKETGRWNGSMLSLSTVLFIAWAFLFLLQGPVYYHLQVCVVLLLWSFDRNRLVKSTLGILLASAWAGISRLNWYPLPAMLASVMYFLETPFGNSKEASVTQSSKDGQATVERWKPFLRYLRKPLGWIVLGITIAFLTQWAYVRLAGINPRFLSSSFTSDLLWYRLLPSATFPLGVLPMILLISAPLMVLLVHVLRPIHWIRKLSISGILIIFFLGGLVVSTKIGGGSNLHNLDAYLTLLLVVSAYGIGQCVENEESLDMEGQSSPFYSIPSWLILVILVMPALYTLGEGEPIELPKRERTEKALIALRKLTSQCVAQGGEVLLISQRHLLTFGDLPGVLLVEPYENVFLMEMVMAGNSAYLQPFYEDLKQQRFCLIVTDPQPSRLKGRAFPFGEENDIWLQRVTQPLLATYQRTEAFKEVGIEMYEPKP